MLYTHGGKSRTFQWRFANDLLTIENEFGRTHEYQLVEIYNILQWLQCEFHNEWFPLANNVEKLGNGTEKKGLGIAIYRQKPGDVTHAQGSSYLGMVLESAQLFEWNGVGDTESGPKSDILGQASAGIRADHCLEFPA